MPPNFLTSLILVIVGGATWSVIQWGFRYAKKSLSMRTYRRFWGSPKDNKMLIVHPLYSALYGGETHLNMARIEDVHAMWRLGTTLKPLGVTVDRQDDHKDLPKEGDIILVCGPAGNSKSVSLVEGAKEKWSFVCGTNGGPNNNWAYILDREDNSRYFSPVDESGVNFDYALVARYTDGVSKRRFFAFWGIKGVGTLGAVEFIRDKKNLKDIWKAIGDEDFAVVLRIGFDGPENITSAVMKTPPRVIT